MITLNACMSEYYCPVEKDWNTNSCVPLPWSYLGPDGRLTGRNGINLIFVYNEERSLFKIYLFLSITLSLYFLILFFCLLIGRFLLKLPFSHNWPVRKSTCTSDTDYHQADITINPIATPESEDSLPLFCCFLHIQGSQLEIQISEGSSFYLEWIPICTTLTRYPTPLHVM